MIRAASGLGPCVLSTLLLLLTSRASARPNTHALSISTWDPRASSVVLGTSRAVSGEGAFTSLSYNANFSSTSGILSAQFGAHYLTYRDTDSSRNARGFSAGGVALFSFPLSDRSEQGIPGSSFALYLGGVPTALFSGQLNFISVPLVLGVGLPFSPASAVTITPWGELSPGLNFDTRIQAVSTADAIQSAMDGTLTRQEVEELVEEGLDISRETSLGGRAGLALALHLGSDVDLDANFMIGAGRGSAIGLGASLVFRWDDLVPGVRPDGERGAETERGAAPDCASLEAQLRSCPAARGFQARGVPPATPSVSPQPAPTTAPKSRGTAGFASPSASPQRPAITSSGPQSPVPRSATSDGARSAPTEVAKKKPVPSAPEPAPALPPVAKPRVPELPPLQAAPPRSP